MAEDCSSISFANEQLSFHLSETEQSDEDGRFRALSWSPRRRRLMIHSPLGRLSMNPSDDGVIRNSGATSSQLSQLLLVAYRWLNHFNLAINQLSSAGEGSLPIDFFMVTIEDVHSRGASPGEERQGGCECEDETTCSLARALRWLNGLTQLYKEVTYQSLNHEENSGRLSRFPTSFSPSASSNRWPATPPKNASPPLMSILFVPSRPTYGRLLSEIRVIEAIVQVSSALSVNQFSEAFLTPNNSEAREVPSGADGILPSQPILDPRMPWNGSLWLAQDPDFPSPLPIQHSRMLDHFADQVTYAAPCHSGEQCKVISACAVHSDDHALHYLLVARAIAPSASGFLWELENENRAMGAQMKEMEEALRAEKEKSARLQSRLDMKMREAPVAVASRRNEMRKRSVMRLEIFDLKRLCACYEELLRELRQLAYDHAMSHSDLMTDILQNRSREGESAIEWTDGMEELINEWATTDHNATPFAVLRCLGEFDSVIEFSADQIDRYRTAYHLDELLGGELSLVSRSASEVFTDAPRGNLQSSSANPPRSLHLVDEVAPHFGMGYRTSLRAPQDTKSDDPTGACVEMSDTPSPQQPHNVIEFLERECRNAIYGGGMDDAERLAGLGAIGTDSNQSELSVGLLQRKIRRYELLLTGAFREPSEDTTLFASYGDDDIIDEIMIVARDLTMSIWCLVQHVGERLIDLADQKDAMDAGRWQKMRRKIKRAVRKVDTEAQMEMKSEKERLSHALELAIAHSYPVKGDQRASRALNSSLHLVKCGREPPSARDVVKELWSALAYLSGRPFNYENNYELLRH
eukprot:GHVH01004371.1.p1 GENE.GHVH01004371.1~~GHVH01004371.1.p1  ORF type:complete len:866 (+),score=151.46 GHVH01004371.1:174-2600(+)